MPEKRAICTKEALAEFNSEVRKFFKLMFRDTIMLKHKRIREKGKIPLSKYFQKIDSGDYVALVTELGIQARDFPKRMQGRTGRVIKKRGSAYVVEVSDFNMKKRYSVKPVHLKKIEVEEKR